GIALREDLALQLRYTIYTQKITLPSYLNDCNNINPDFFSTLPTPAAVLAAINAGLAYPGFNPLVPTNCYLFGQASLPVRAELAAGSTLTSLAGYGLTYNTLDNNKSPTSGLLLTAGQDFAGIGGDVAYMRSAVNFNSYYEVVPDLITIVHLQAGNMIGLGGQAVRLLDDLNVAPILVRGFPPAGLGPRDTTPGTAGDALGGTNY